MTTKPLRPAKNGIIIKQKAKSLHFFPPLKLMGMFDKNDFFYRESVVGSVIQATGTVEFEDGLRMGVFPGGCWGP